MQEKDVLVSVIITCYNKESFINETIESVLQQTGINFIKEIIVVDDGSKDNSAGIIQNRQKQNSLIKYLYQINAGVSAARNAGITAATGNYIAFLDGDDIWEKDKIQLQADFAQRYPQVGLFYSDIYRYLYKANKTVPVNVIPYQYNDEKFLYKFVAKGAPVYPSTAFIKKECFDTSGLFDESLLHGGEDIDMWLRIATNYPFQHIKKYLVKKREIENSLGADTYENAKGYKIALDKLEAKVPAIAPYRKKRDALIHYKVGLFFYKKGDNARALNELKKAFKTNASLFKSYVLLSAIIIKRVLGLKILK